MKLPPEFGQLHALNSLALSGCSQLILAPGAEVGKPAQTIVAAYVAEEKRKLQLETDIMLTGTDYGA